MFTQINRYICEEIRFATLGNLRRVLGPGKGVKGAKGGDWTRLQTSAVQKVKFLMFTQIIIYVWKRSDLQLWWSWWRVDKIADVCGHILPDKIAAPSWIISCRPNTCPANSPRHQKDKNKNKDKNKKYSQGQKQREFILVLQHLTLKTFLSCKCFSYLSALAKCIVLFFQGSRQRHNIRLENRIIPT